MKRLYPEDSKRITGLGDDGAKNFITHANKIYKKHPFEVTFSKGSTENKIEMFIKKIMNKDYYENKFGTEGGKKEAPIADPESGFGDDWFTEQLIRKLNPIIERMLEEQ